MTGEECVQTETPDGPIPLYRRGAESGSRTRTSLRTSVFETDASACSATSAHYRGAPTIPLAGANRPGPAAALDSGRLRPGDFAERLGEPGRRGGRGQRLPSAHLATSGHPAH